MRETRNKTKWSECERDYWPVPCVCLRASFSTASSLGSIHFPLFTQFFLAVTNDFLFQTLRAFAHRSLVVRSLPFTPTAHAGALLLIVLREWRETNVNGMKRSCCLTGPCVTTGQYEPSRLWDRGSLTVPWDQLPMVKLVPAWRWGSQPPVSITSRLVQLTDTELTTGQYEPSRLWDWGSINPPLVPAPVSVILVRMPVDWYYYADDWLLARWLTPADDWYY